MCGRVRLPNDYSEIKIKLKLDDIFPAPNFPPRWNIPPSAKLLCVVCDPETGKRRPVMMRWGLIPSWAKNDKSAILTQLNARMSLRKPQTRSLEILADVLNKIEISKAADVTGQLEVIRHAHPSVTAFERDFPSLCFALATGVGKTRLMGAFVAYLYLAKGIKHFFVLAPNSTIYEKLIDDFTPGNRDGDIAAD